MKNRHVLLSFDVEEFDMPLEFGNSITLTEQLDAGKRGLDAIKPLLNDANLSATLFTTAFFAEQYPDDIRQLAQRHEIASHTYFHSWFTREHLLQSKQKLESITEKKVNGFRMPRMNDIDAQLVANAGYTYDSSIHPTWIPGKYNHLRAPRTITQVGGIQRIPASVSPFLRIPLFWLSFKNFPYSFYRYLVRKTLQHDGYCCLYFHPWEFISLSKFGLPKYTHRIDGDALTERLDKLIRELHQEAEFISMGKFIAEKKIH